MISARQRTLVTGGAGFIGSHLVRALLQSSEVELGNLTPECDYVFVDDVADPLMALAAVDRRGVDIINVGTGGAHFASELAWRAKFDLRAGLLLLFQRGRLC